MQARFSYCLALKLEGFLWKVKMFLFLKVDGNTNPKIQSIHLEDFPVYKASFSADGEQVIASSLRNKLFYIYDMMGGKIIPVKRIRGEINCFFSLHPQHWYCLCQAHGYIFLSESGSKIQLLYGVITCLFFSI